MTTNKPEVVAYRYTASRSFGKRNRKWHYQERLPVSSDRRVQDIGQMEQLIRLGDYEALQAECERLRACLRMEIQAGDNWKMQLRKVVDECDHLRRDSDRYRWLRDSVIGGADAAFIGVWSESACRYIDEFADQPDFDDAIDAAMQEAQHE